MYMFPNDEEIWLEDSIHHGIGMEKFEDLQSMEDGRNRVHIAVNTLKSCFLLLNRYAEETTKMYDVPLLISSQGKNKQLVKAGVGLAHWKPRNYSEATQAYL